MNEEEFNDLVTAKIEHCGTSDQSGCCFVAREPNDNIDLELALKRFRKYRLEIERPDVSESRRFRLFNEIENEMEQYKTSNVTNYNEYLECIRVWGDKLPEWVLSVYTIDMYLAHLSFRDKESEGVYESVTETDGIQFYLYHG